ncbi:MAG: hypothetical protein K2G09_00610 [Paramuribaculum sp.]|nr:hypothetical protein [Paramuribaculum sp.]
MKRIANRILVLFAVILGFTVTGCVSSDPETEQQLAGTWETSFTESEDGVQIVASSTETYSLEGHEYSCVLRYAFGYPIFEHFVTVTYSGNWKASKKTIEVDIDKNSIDFSFNKSITDKSDREEFKQEMLLELKKSGYSEESPILTSITDKFETEDEDGERLVYTRVK